MQQVNSLPITLSQEPDFNDKITHKPNTENSSCFSVLVDRYLERTSDASDKSTGQVVENSPSKDDKGQIIAADGKADTNQSIKKSLLNEEQQLQQQELDKKDSIESASGEEVETSTALTESEEFISLLYYSDNALLEKEQQTQKSLDSSQNNLSANNKALGVEHTLLVADSNKETSNVKNNNIGSNTENINIEHKLKTFISDNKNNDALTRYQQSLSAKEDALNTGKNLTLADISTNDLGESELDKNVNREKSVLLDGIQTKEKSLSQAVLTGGKPVITELTSESIEKELGKLANNASVESTTGLERGANIEELEKNGKIIPLKNSEITTNEKLISTSGVSNTESPKVVKENINTSNQIYQTVIDDNVLQSVSNEKANNAAATEHKVSATQSSHIENIIKSSSANQKSAADVIKDQVVTEIENSAAKNINSDEYTLAEDDFVAAKTSEVLLKNDTPQTSNANQTRPLIDIHNQATQIKHDTSAYNAYEASVKVDQTAVSEVVQTQKNNVQLHQETISIFRKDFAEAVKDKVMLVISQKLQQFDITLDPPEFGNMQVRVNLQGEQAAVNFVVQNQSAKEAIEQNMHKLKEMLAEQGVDVGGADVQQQSQQQSEKGDDTSHSSSHENSHSKNSADSSEHVLSAELVNSSASGVDYYV